MGTAGTARTATGIKKAVLGGWNISGILRYESGRPLNITMANDLGGFLFNEPEASQSRSGRRRRRCRSATSIRTRTATSIPPRGPIRDRCSSATRRGTTGPCARSPIYSEDVNLFKVFPVSGDRKFRFEAMFGNIFNRTLFCDPNTNWSAGSFGTVNTQCNQPRSIQLAVAVRLLMTTGPDTRDSRGCQTPG